MNLWTTLLQARCLRKHVYATPRRGRRIDQNLWNATGLGHNGCMRTNLRGDNHSDTRERNLRMVLRSLSRYGPLSRRQISELSGLAPGTITGLVGDLIERRILVAAGAERTPGSKGGPSRILLDFNADGVAVFGVAVGVYGRGVTLCGPRGDVLGHRYSLDYSARTTFEEQVDWIARSVNELIEERGLPKSAVLGIGVGAEGRVIARSGGDAIVPYGESDEYPIARRLEAKTGLPAVVVSAIHADTFGEIWFGAGKGIGQLLCVSVGTTIGVSAVIRHEVARGHNDLGGDFSHVVVDPGGTPCICGKRGCLEAVAGVQSVRRQGQDVVRSSARTIMRELCNDDPEQLTSELVALAAGQRDPEASAIIARAGRYIAEAIAPVVAAFAPEAVVLLGEVPRRSKEQMMAVVADGIAEFGLRPGQIAPTVITGTVDVPPGTALGAAALALDRFFFSPQLAHRGMQAVDEFVVSNQGS